MSIYRMKEQKGSCPMKHALNCFGSFYEIESGSGAVNLEGQRGCMNECYLDVEVRISVSLPLILAFHKCLECT